LAESEQARRIARLTAGAVGCLLLLSAAFGADLPTDPAPDWPQLRGPGRTGTCRASPRLVDTWPAWGPKVLWEMPLPDLPVGLVGGATGSGTAERFRGAASPVIAGGRLYVHTGTVNEGAYSRLIARRRQLAEQYGPERAEELKAPPEFQEIAAAFPKLKTHTFLCIDPADGKVLWRTDLPAGEETGWFSSSTPTIADGRLFFLAKHGQAICLGTEDGRVLWHRLLTQHVGAGRHGRHASVTVVDGVAIVPVGGQGTYGLGAATGEVVWHQPKAGGTVGSATPWESGGRTMAVATGACLDVKTGEVLWRVAADDESAIAIQGDCMAVANPWSADPHQITVYEISPQEAKPVFSVTTSAQAGSPILDGPRLYFRDRHRYVCVDLQTRNTLWEARVGPGRHFSYALLVDGKIIGLSTWALWMLDAASGKALGRWESYQRFPDRHANLRSPAVWNGRLFVIQDDTLVWADLTEAGPPTDEWKQAQGQPAQTDEEARKALLRLLRSKKEAEEETRERAAEKEQ
jgi:hypothetical protein